jgi:hypothetical protein
VSTPNRFGRLLRDPLVHFLLIGAAIYAAYGLLDPAAEAEDAATITVSQGEIKSITEQWTRLWNRPPTEAELAGALRTHVRTRILYKEALSMGLDRNDQVIERRLAQKIELLSRSLVVPEPPSDEVLAAWYAENPDQFRAADTYTLSQVFFDPDLRGDSTSADAAAALATLQAMDAVPEDLSAYGDRGIVGSYYAGRDETQLSRVFGGGFVKQLVQLGPGRWHGPVLSGYGTHLVYVHHVVKAEPPALADIREQVQEAWMLEQVEERSAAFIDELIERYDVVVEATEVPLTVPPETPVPAPSSTPSTTPSTDTGE